jgi:ArsR family transcriptional regulator
MHVYDKMMEQRVTTVKLSPEQFDRVASAISDRRRYEILREIYSRIAVTPGQISKFTAISKPTISHHIRLLAGAELIHVEREGRLRLLSARTETWVAFLEQLRNIGSGERVRMADTRVVPDGHSGLEITPHRHRGK